MKTLADFHERLKPGALVHVYSTTMRKDLGVIKLSQVRIAALKSYTADEVKFDGEKADLYTMGKKVLTYTFKD